jgi:hypothetical protein
MSRLKRIDEAIQKIYIIEDVYVIIFNYTMIFKYKLFTYINE